MSAGRIRRIGCAATILVLLALGVGAYWAWDRARAAPAWYAPPDPVAPQVATLAETVEYRLVEEAQRIRPQDTTWTLRLRDEQLNAWLAARLPEWLEHERDTSWPDDLGTPQVRIEQDTVSLAIAVETTGGGPPQVVVARLRPELTEAGLLLHVDRVGLGRLMLPGAAIGRLAGALERAGAPAGGGEEPGAIATILNLLGDPEPIAPRFDLADGRTVELMGFRMYDGAIDVQNRTLAPRRIREAAERIER